MQVGRHRSGRPGRAAEQRGRVRAGDRAAARPVRPERRAGLPLLAPGGPGPTFSTRTRRRDGRRASASAPDSSTSRSVRSSTSPSPTSPTVTPPSSSSSTATAAPPGTTPTTTGVAPLYIGAFVRTAGIRVVLWQIPLGNTKMRAENNTWDHYQDNKVEWLLDDPTPGPPATPTPTRVSSPSSSGEAPTGPPAPATPPTTASPTRPPSTATTASSLNADDDGGFFHRKGQRLLPDRSDRPALRPRRRQQSGVRRACPYTPAVPEPATPVPAVSPHPLLRLWHHARPPPPRGSSWRRSSPSSTSCSTSRPELLIGVAIDVVVRRRRQSFVGADLRRRGPRRRSCWSSPAITVVVWILESLTEYLAARDSGGTSPRTIEHDLRMDAYAPRAGPRAGAGSRTAARGGLLTILNDDVNQLERFLDVGADEHHPDRRERRLRRRRLRRRSRRCWRCSPSCRSR